MADICPGYTNFLGSDYKTKNPDEFGSDGKVRVCFTDGRDIFTDGFANFTRISLGSSTN